MQTFLPTEFLATDRGKEADSILRACVHCGFCTATCPTYQVLGNELDSPRGRIYLIKAMLEGEAVTAVTRTHLDRCLTCQSCETTCPSGVNYHRLLDIGRAEVEQALPPWSAGSSPSRCRPRFCPGQPCLARVPFQGESLLRCEGALEPTLRSAGTVRPTSPC